MMKVKKEWILLGLIALAALGYLLIRNDSRLGYKLPRWKSLKQEHIIEIQIQREGALVSLRPSWEGWVMGESAKKMDEQKMESLLEQIESLSILDMVSQSGDYQRFGLEEEQVLKVWIVTQKETRELWLGKASSTGGGTYLRLPQEEGVYVLSGDWNSLLPDDIWELRDKGIVALEDISSISLQGKNQSVAFQWVGEQWVDDSGDALSNQEEAFMLQQQLLNLRCENFLEEPRETEELILTISINQGVQDLIVYGKEENRYLCRSSQVDDDFYLSTYLVDNWLNIVE